MPYKPTRKGPKLTEPTPKQTKPTKLTPKRPKEVKPTQKQHKLYGYINTPMAITYKYTYIIHDI